ncbi:uncharacterized protein [Panulirus ornatus]|uniref:uncharacterized protein isoform X2 n=1 Tax=Panulirus ornatus TaxID=150431 RepID=UPI003A83CEBB
MTLAADRPQAHTNNQPNDSRVVIMWVRRSPLWLLVFSNVMVVFLAERRSKLVVGAVNDARGRSMTGSLLGEECLVNSHCGVTSGVCHKGRCLCKPHYLAINATTCLPGAPLGFPCQANRQCSRQVADSICVHGYCRCRANFVPSRRNTCLKAWLSLTHFPWPTAARVGDPCQTHDQCRLGSKGSFCDVTVPWVQGQCRCANDLPRIGHTCGHLRYSLGSPCNTSGQCSSSVQGSVCVISLSSPLPTLEDVSPNSISAIPGVPPRPLGVPVATCGCPPGYQEAENGSRCAPVVRDVTPVSLGQRCQGSHQCRASDPFTYCRAGVCHCVFDSPECSAANRGCHKHTFQCLSSGRCISWYYVCNGVRECEDGSDETSCLPRRCPSLAHTCDDGTCISRAKLCDGNVHCPDGSDEASCNETCPATAFRCGDGRCLPAFVFCNGTPTCSDGSDEPEAACIKATDNLIYCPFRLSSSALGDVRGRGRVWATPDARQLDHHLGYDVTRA